MQKGQTKNDLIKVVYCNIELVRFTITVNIIIFITTVYNFYIVIILI